jgi:hypothetical protein
LLDLVCCIPKQRGHFLDECVGGGGAENGQYTVSFVLATELADHFVESLAFTTREQQSWLAKENSPWGTSWLSFQEMRGVCSSQTNHWDKRILGCALEARLFRGQVVQNEHNGGRCFEVGKIAAAVDTRNAFCLLLIDDSCRQVHSSRDDESTAVGLSCRTNGHIYRQPGQPIGFRPCKRKEVSAAAATAAAVQEDDRDKQPDPKKRVFEQHRPLQESNGAAPQSPPNLPRFCFFISITKGFARRWDGFFYGYPICSDCVSVSGSIVSINATSTKKT